MNNAKWLREYCAQWFSTHELKFVRVPRKLICPIWDEYAPVPQHLQQYENTGTGWYLGSDFLGRTAQEAVRQVQDLPRMAGDLVRD